MRAIESDIESAKRVVLAFYFLIRDTYPAHAYPDALIIRRRVREFVREAAAQFMWRKLRWLDGTDPPGVVGPALRAGTAVPWRPDLRGTIDYKPFMVGTVACVRTYRHDGEPLLVPRICVRYS